MAHESGIVPSSELSEYLKTLDSSSVRALKIVIKGEELVLAAESRVQSSVEDDFDRSIHDFPENDKPCYIFVRLDSKNANNHYEWVFICYSPDICSVRDKMTYASTSLSIKRVFLNDAVKIDYFTNQKNDVSFQGYQSYLTMKNANKPMTDMEIHAKEAAKEEQLFVASHTRSYALPGIPMSVDPAVVQKIQDMEKNKINYIQLKIDMSKEEIICHTAETIKVDRLSSLIPKDEPRFHVFNYSHMYESSPVETKVFIYSFVGFKCSIKHRMVYSACKAALINFVAEYFPDLKRMEIEDPTILTEEYLIREIHPPPVEVTKKFDKPKRPGKR